MGKPVTISFTFQTQAGPIPLSELDNNFSALSQTVNDFGTYGNYLVDTSGAANTITVTTPVGTTFNYTAGVPLQVQLANTNTLAGVQINVNGLGNKAVQNIDGSVFAVGQLVAGMILQMQFNGTVFLLTGAASKSAGTAGVTSITGTTNQIAASSPTGAVTLSFPQNVVIPAPISGVTLQVNGVAGQNYIGVGTTSDTTSLVTINGAAASKPSTVLNVNGIQAVEFVANFSGGADSFGMPNNSYGIFGFNNTGTLVFGNQSHLTMSLSGAGAVTIAAPSSGQALTVNGFGANGIYGLQVAIPAVAGTRGLYIHDNGAGATGFPFVVDNATNNLFVVAGDGGIAVGPGASSQGIGTINVSSGYFVNGIVVGATTGSFTAGTTGQSGATIACKWTKDGNSVTMFLGVPSTLVSNATTYTLTGLPAAIQATTAKFACCPSVLLNNSTLQQNAVVLVNAGSTLTFENGAGGASAWTGSNNKAIGDGVNGVTLTWSTD